MPPSQVRQMGNTKEEVRRVLDHWKSAVGGERPDYNGAWWSELPSVLQIQEIRNFLDMPALDGPEFAGVLHG
eukprot:9570248-Alexandrium_andersonii.AAC.1